MLKIVKSGFSSSAREAFYDRIATLVKEEKRAFLIVPEQQTVMAESLMSRILPPSSALCFEVTNFTRLANTTFRSLGGLSGEYCDSAKKSLIMWRTLTELSPTLSMTSGRGEINAGLVESALAAVSEMQNKGISPAGLLEVCEMDEIKTDRRLLSRISDLASIYSLYKSLLSERYQDTGDDADAMIKRLEQNPGFLADSEIFIEGFTSFTEPQYRLIALLGERCPVSVALTLPKGREEAFEFSEIADTERRLISHTRRRGVGIKLSREEGRLHKIKEELDLISARLWSTIRTNDKISLQNNDSLRIFEAKTPYEECSFICDDIKRRVMSGASYSDFAIIARCCERYDGILDSALNAAKIPAFTSYRKDIQEFEAIKLIYTAYAVCRGFRREDVISYAKCALAGVSREECDEFEMYVNKWQISGRRFMDDAVWNMNPAGYTSKKSENNAEKLMRIHDIRTRITEPLLELYRDVRAAATVRAQAECLLNFLLRIDLERSLEARADHLASLGESALAEENRTLWRLICNALDIIVTVLDDMPADFEVFLSQLKVVLSATDIGRIPAFVDQVTVGGAEMLRLYNKPHIYLIGVNAGVFPATVSDRSYFSERDRRLLSSAGLALSPELEIKGARELYIFSRAFSYATESVTLSYSSADTRFKAIDPAEVVQKILDLTGGAVKVRKISDLDAKDRLFTAKNALNELGQTEKNYADIKDALVRAGYDERVKICEGDISNSKISLGLEVVDGLKNKTLTLSQSKIDSYVSCPFGYFCRYAINLSADERAEFDAGSIGSFIHGILENFFRALSREGRSSGELSKDERIALTKAAAEKYISDLGEDMLSQSVRTKIKIDRLCRAAIPVVDGLCDEFSKSAFEPRYFELFIGRDAEAPDPIEMKTDNGIIKIYGVIDRVDAYKRGEDVYLRVIDYKTGQKAFSPDDLAEGSNLQMFLYLKALVESQKDEYKKSLGIGESGKIIPAGVIYVKTAVSDVRIDTPDDTLAEMAVKEAQEREGMMLDDPDVISAMTLRYSPVYSPSYPDEIRQNKRHLLYTEESWGDLMKTVEDAVLNVSDGIREGIMDASPNERKGKSPCEYCEFKPICRKA